MHRNQRMAVVELSEREKRALAAEKRLALQFSQDSSVQRYTTGGTQHTASHIAGSPSTELGLAAGVGVA